MEELVSAAIFVCVGGENEDVVVIADGVFGS